jgi:xanthine dehydrogenase accessory factor
LQSSPSMERKSAKGCIREMKQIVREMVNLAAHGEPFALATVISRNGSAPRSTGAKMLVKQDGDIVGTVGGGMLEAQVRRLAAQMIAERRAAVQSFQFNGKDAADMVAICGGQVEVLVEWMAPGDPQAAAVIRGLQASIDQHRKAWLVTILASGLSCSTHALVQFDGTVLGELPAGMTPETILEVQLPEQVAFAQLQVMIEPVNIAGTAYIFGAGHVSRSLAQFVKAVGFHTVILDDRAEYASRERFPEADEIVILDSFANFEEKIAFDSDSYIVIITRGHQNDLTVLAQALKFEAAYIGMIGSRRKCELIFQELRRLGFQETDIRRVHAPIGIAIQAETPEEIGISIVAEMIQARAKTR